MANVLIINDDATVTKALKAHLAEGGHDISVVERAGAGYDKAVEALPDVIMLDFVLPDATGSQVCHKLRANALTRSIPIIMTTRVGPHPHHESFARAMGANEYLSAPLKVFEVGEIVDRYVQAKHKRPVLPPSLKLHKD